MDNENKVCLIGEITLQKETIDLREMASSVIKLPSKEEKQPDLLYMTALFCSSGTNLNLAHFLPSELVKAEGTIVSKALDVEHKESDVIGHIIKRSFVDREGSELDLNNLVSAETSDLDKKELDVLIACVVYKARFPELAKEISEGKWCVSMEAYFSDYDLLIGDLILSKKEAEVLGIALNDDNVFGKTAKVVKDGIEVATGKIARVLRGIVFSGVGIVKSPANITSVVLETANTVKKDEDVQEDTIILNYDKLEQNDNKVTFKDVETKEKSDDITKEKENAEDMEYDDTIGICVSYKKRVIDATFEGPGVKVLHEDWCTFFEEGCTSFSRDTTDSKCLRNVKQASITAFIASNVDELIKKKEMNDRREQLLNNLNSVLDEVKN